MSLVKNAPYPLQMRSVCHKTVDVYLPALPGVSIIAMNF